MQTCAKAPTKKSCFTAVQAIHQDNAWPMGRNAWTVVSSTTSKRYAGAEVQLSITSKQVPDQCDVEEDHINTVNINSITFNSKWLTITINLKMVTNQVSVIISYR